MSLNGKKAMKVSQLVCRKNNCGGNDFQIGLTESNHLVIRCSKCQDNILVLHVDSIQKTPWFFEELNPAVKVDKRNE